MPRIKNEPADSSSPKGMIDEELMDERFELACVEESAGDDADERSFSAKFVSSPNSPQYGAHGEEEEEEEEAAVDLNMEEVEDGQKHNKRSAKRANDSDDEESGEVGPKTPPDGEEMEEKSGGENGTKSRKRRHSSAHSRSRSKDSSSSRSSYSRSRDGSESSRNSSSSYRERKLRKYEGDRSVDDRIRQNKESRLIRLRNARSRQLGYEYIPPLSKSSRAFPPQPYFKNPSFYPGEQRDKSKPLAPPPPAQRIAPLPGGRLPLVQRRSSPPPFESSRQRSRSPPPAKPPSTTRWRRTIVEDTIRVTAKRSPSPRSSSSRRSPSSYSSRSSTRKEYLGPQTLYPSRRDPYPPSYRPSNGRDYDRRPASYKSAGSSSSDSNARGMFIFTGTKYVPRPFIPPPPPGKKWNCPRRESVGEKKWNCPKRENSRTPPRR